MVEIDRNIAAQDIDKMELFSFFSGERYLSKYLNKLASADIYTVGDMAQNVQGNVFDAFPTSERNRSLIVSDLAKVGVHIS